MNVLRKKIEELDKRIEKIKPLDFYEIIRLKASRNSKVRLYNKTKNFWNRKIKEKY